MKGTYTSIGEVEKELFPSEIYQKRLIEKGKFNKLAKYLIKNNMELDSELIKDIPPKKAGTLSAKIIISKIGKLAIN